MSVIFSYSFLSSDWLDILAHDIIRFLEMCTNLPIQVSYL